MMLFNKLQSFTNPGVVRGTWSVVRRAWCVERKNCERETLCPATPEPRTSELRIYKTFLFASGLVLFAGLLIAPKLCAQPVRAGAAYLKILPGTRQQGVSGSMTAGLDEPFSIYSNPGATGLLREWQLDFSYTKWIANINNASLFVGKRFSFSTPFGRNIYAGLGVNNQSVDVQSTNGLAPAASASDLLITGTLGLPFDKIIKNLSLGANVKYLKSNLDVSSVNALIYDVGLLYRTERFDFPLLPFDGIFSLGGSVNHLGKRLKFQKLETPLPRVYRLGAGLNFGTHDGLQIQLVGDFRRIRDEVDQYGIGLEVMNILSVIPVMNKMGGRFLSARVGWLESDGQDKNILNKLSLGISLNFDDFMNNRAKSKNGGFAAPNTAWRVDMANQSNVSVSGDVSHFGGALFPNGPEAFEFVLDKKFMTTDTSDAYFHYDLGDEVELTWQASRDPDLYDFANYIVLVTKDRAELEKMLASSIFETPQGAVNTVLYHPVTTGKDKPAELHGDTIEKNENHISYATINSSEVELFYFFPHQIKAEKLVDISNIIGSKLEIKRATTFTFSKKENQFKYSYRPVRGDCNYSGDYYWSIIAYDKNFHQRVVGGAKNNIAHFKVVGRPDLTIKIHRVDSVSSPLPETFTLEDVHFAFNKADISYLDSASKDSLEKWVQRLSHTNYDSILVFGYADATGPDEVNKRLSQVRAQSIVKYLKHHRVRSVYYHPVGFGETALLPRASNETLLEWNRRNRRVRMRVVKKPPPPQHFARLDITNVGQVESPAGFTVNIFNRTHNFLKKPAQVALGASALLVTPFELDILADSNGKPASGVPGYIDADLNIHPDSSNFRFDVFARQNQSGLAPDTSFQISEISCGETISLLTKWNEQNRFLVAVVDPINKVEEVSEHNNWDIEQLLATDLEISKNIKRIKPLPIWANFEPNRDFLNKDSQLKLLMHPLEELKLALDKLEFQNTYLEIGGHTDEIGSDVFNNDLSFRRAKWIKNFIVKQFDFDPTRISAIGYGESKPLHDSVSYKYAKFSPNWLAKHKDNRRIELRWLKNTTGIAPPDTICNSPNCTPANSTVKAVFVGQKVEYQILVKNLSQNLANHFKVIDILPHYFKLENHSVDSPIKMGFSVKDDSLTWTPSIAGGDSIMLNYTVELDKSFVNLIQRLENKARVISHLDYNVANNADSTSITGIGNIVTTSQLTPKPKPKPVTVHIVQCGESLSTISAMYYGNIHDYEEIQSANGIIDPGNIEVGDRLKIPKSTIIAQGNYRGSMGIVTYGALKVGSEIGGHLKNKTVDKGVPDGNLMYRWLREGVVIENCATYILQPEDVTKQLTLEIIVAGAKEMVFRYDLPSIAENKAPIVANVKIEGNLCRGGVLEGRYNYDDPEGDQDRSKYRWLRNGQLVGQSITYVVDSVDVGFPIKFVVIPSDKFTMGKTVASPAVLIPKLVEYTEDCEIITSVSLSQN